MDQPPDETPAGIDGMSVHDTAINNVGEHEPSISLEVNTAGNNEVTPSGDIKRQKSHIAEDSDDENDGVRATRINDNDTVNYTHPYV